jgi:hypothetical protein
MGLYRNVVVASGLAMATLTFAPRARAADVVITEDARTHFSAGVALLQDPKAPRYEEAYREFKAAYAASPSYKILGNLGLCAMKIERDAEAIHAYETYLKEAGPELTTEQRAQVQRDLLTLRSGLLEVTVSSDPPGATIVDTRVPVEGADIKNSYGSALTPLSLGLRHGHHVVTARLAGYVDQPWEFDATEATAAPHVFTMTKPTLADRAVVRERPIPAAAYVVGGLTAALAIGGAVTGVLALSKHSDFQQNNDGLHVAAAQSDRSSGQTLNIVTDSLFIGAIVGAAVTTYLVLSRDTVERAASDGVHGSTRQARAMPVMPAAVSPTMGAHSAGASALWVF